MKRYHSLVMKSAFFGVALLWLLALCVDAHANNSISCRPDPHPFDELDNVKKRYKVGVHAIRGVEAAFHEYNKTFGEYLTATAGRQFDPPIEFEVVPVDFRSLFDAVDAKELDFFYANPGIYTCVGVETGALPLATIVSHLEVRGKEYDLDVFGGVIFTRADNFEIDAISDLKGKIIGAGAIQMILAGQQQFYEMLREGLSYIMDPKQVVFTYQQYDVVRGVLNGDFDVGFVRTDTIERTTDEEGNLLDTDLFKVINQRVFVMENGDLFPFLHSTDIYPEWLIAALTHTSSLVSREVQNALLAMQAHAEAGQMIENGSVYHPERCDTTAELAKLAYGAAQRGKLAGFRPTMSYFEVRTMQQAAGFLNQDERGEWKCTRAATLYDSIKCPEGHYKKKPDEYERSCPQIGLSCKEGWDCYCQPCVKANEVEVYEIYKPNLDETGTNGTAAAANGGCDKMSVCGTVQQTKTITFVAVDHRIRDEATLTVAMHIAGKTESVPVTVVGEYTYQFSWSSQIVGVGIMEIAIDGEQIPASPMRVEVTERLCNQDHPGQNRDADASGSCICRDNTIQMGGNCVSSTVVAVVVSVFFVFLALALALLAMQHKTRKNDQLWHVAVEELHFDDPIEIIGEGSFGQVIKAEYRGTPVAIKRVLRSNDRRRRRNSSAVVENDEEKTTNLLSFNSSQNTTFGSSDSQCGFVSDVDEPEAELHLKSTPSAPSFVAQDTLDFLEAGFSFDYGSNARGAAKWVPWSRGTVTGSKIALIGTTTSAGTESSISSNTVKSLLCPWFDEHTQQKNAFINEMRLLSRLRHPCITTVMGAVCQPRTEPMLVMEYCEYGSLTDLLANESMHAGGEIILQIVRDISQGLRYLHSAKPIILHGDLKAKNILIDARFRAKVCDFGLSNKKQNSLSGSPFWMAPEYLRQKTQYNAACDIYSFGIILYEIYSRKLPYEGENPRSVLHAVCNPRKNKRPEIPPTMPPKMVELMKKCWSPDSFYRPHARDLDSTFLEMSFKDADPVSKGMRGSLNGQQRKTGDMLYQVFPRHIADALKTGEKVEPESHDIVTIFFSDIVGFTTISQSLSPLKVSNMLDRLYLAVDGLAEIFKVFKIETIGDAWMGVTNLSGTQENDHVKAIAEFAMAAVEAANGVLIDEEEPDRGHVKIRVGFHSGHVVSNVIGSLNPRYGLFGDTVNVASRMESNSKSGRIHCSEVSANLLHKQAPEIKLSKRGKIHVKGKGDMTTFWVGMPRRESGYLRSSIGLADRAELCETCEDDLASMQESQIKLEEEVTFDLDASQKDAAVVECHPNTLDRLNSASQL